MAKRTNSVIQVTSAGDSGSHFRRDIPFVIGRDGGISQCRCPVRPLFFQQLFRLEILPQSREEVFVFRGIGERLRSFLVRLGQRFAPKSDDAGNVRWKVSASEESRFRQPGGGGK